MIYQLQIVFLLKLAQIFNNYVQYKEYNAYHWIMLQV